jgi:hypothetical protein
MSGNVSGEGKAHEAALFLGLIPEVDADEAFGVKRPGGLFERLANHCGDELLTALDMSGGLIEQQTLTDPFLDQEELTIAFDDGRDGQIGPQ